MRAHPRSFLLVFLTAAMLLGVILSVPGVAAADTGIPAAAGVLPLSASGTLDSVTNAHDVFAVQLEAGQTLRVFMGAGEFYPFRLRLLGPGAGSLLDAPTVDVLSSEGRCGFEYTAVISGVYLIDAYAPPGAGTAAYALDAWLLGVDADGTLPGTPMALPISIRGMANYAWDTADVYQVVLRSGQRVNLVVESQSLSAVTLSVYGPGATDPLHSVVPLAVTETRGDSSPLSFTAPVDGTYYFECQSTGYFTSGWYTLNASLGTPIGITIGSTAYSVRLPKTFNLTGLVTPGALHEWVNVMVKKPGKRYWSYSSARLVYGMSGTSGKWWYRYAPKLRGTYYFYSKSVGNAAHGVMSSRTIKVVVR